MTQIRDVLEDIYNRIQQRTDLEESEVTDVFTDNDFFQTLGYEGIPIDVRSENHIALIPIHHNTTVSRTSRSVS